MGIFSSQKAIILREVKYKEADRILTMYASDVGKITAKAPGALRKSSKLSASTQMLTYSDVVLVCKDGKYNVSESSIIEQFKGLREDFESYALGCYFAECVESFGIEDVYDKQLMQLILNSLYALSNHLYSPLQIKAAFEFRLMCISGYQPDLDRCCVCNKENISSPTFGFETGHVCCRECRNAEVGLTDYLCSASLSAMKYISNCSPKSLFSFSLEDDSLKRLSDACEDYILYNSGRKFGTLDYWKKIKI